MRWAENWRKDFARARASFTDGQLPAVHGGAYPANQCKAFLHSPIAPHPSPPKNHGVSRHPKKPSCVTIFTLSL